MRGKSPRLPVSLGLTRRRLEERPCDAASDDRVFHALGCAGHTPSINAVPGYGIKGPAALTRLDCFLRAYKDKAPRNRATNAGPNSAPSVAAQCY